MFLGSSFFWILLGLLLVGAEMFIPGFVVFFFGIGAVVTGIAAAIFPFIKGSVAMQGIVWIAATAFFMGFFRKKFAGIFKGTILNRQIESNVGKSAEVMEPITPDTPGRVRYQGTSWKAISYTEKFDKGDVVDIVEEEGLAFIVSKHLEL
ncbi:MAG: NfeD family protein [Spirochaetes bacterium]|nr:MAG: NfeD family protein [Spirochaetota bacterium]